MTKRKLKKIKSETHQKPPTFMGMLKSFAKDVTKYIAEGAPNVTPDDYLGRLTECKKCPHLKMKHMRCGLCGCLIEHKAKWKTAECPDNPPKWKKQNLENEK